MSSDPDPHSPKTPMGKGMVSAGLALALMSAAPLSAQDDPPVTPSQAKERAEPGSGNAQSRPSERRREFEGVNLLVTVPRNESDALLDEDCEDEADAGKISGEIVVCRQLGEASDGSWNKEEWQRDYARRTQGGSTPDVAGGGIFRGPATVSGMCVIPPCPPEAAIMIDVEALPEAPAGSDADRIARGLPPLGRDSEMTPEEIQRRRRELGLDAPPVPEE